MTHGLQAHSGHLKGALRTRNACGVLQPCGVRAISGEAPRNAPLRSIFPKLMAEAASSRPVPIANGLVYVKPKCRAGPRAHMASFRYRDAKGQWLRDDTRSPASGVRDSASVHRCLDLSACQRPSAGDRDRCARPQAIPLPRQMAPIKDETKFERLEAFGRALPRSARAWHTTWHRARGRRRRRASRCSPPGALLDITTCAWATRNMRAAMAPSA